MSEDKLGPFIEQAIAKSNGDPDMAANLVVRWSESNSEVREALWPEITAMIRRRILAQAKRG